MYNIDNSCVVDTIINLFDSFFVVYVLPEPPGGNYYEFVS